MGKSHFSFEEILADAEEDSLELPLAEHIFKGFQVFASLIAFVILFQVFKIGFWSGKDYAQKAAANASNYRVIKAERGLITDRGGKALVGNEKAFFAYLVVKELPKSDTERDNILEAVAQALDLNKEAVEASVLKLEPYFDDRVFLKDFLAYDELVKISALNLQGVHIEEGFRRSYNAPLVFSHVLGYTGLVTAEDADRLELASTDEIGKTGLEKFYDKYLRGKNGREVFFRDSLGAVKERKVADLPEQGNRVETFIDGELQEYFYNRLQEELTRLDRKIGVGIAMNPKNGEVLAFFGVPGFDAKEIVKYLNDKNRIFFNRAVSGLYNPASTIKPLHAMAALAENVIAPEKKIFSAGYIEIPNPYSPANPSIFRDWRAHGWIDTASALARSSNVYFYAIGGGFKDQAGLGIKRLKKWWESFNLDKKTGIDLPGEESGFLPDPDWKKEKTGRNWLLGDTYNVSIGQGDFVITPMGLLNYINSIANGGKFYRPRVVNKVLSSDGKTVLENKEEVLNDIGEKIVPYVQYVREGMRDGVIKDYGTSYMLHDIPLEIHAKTGSAQVENKTKTNAFFTGFTDDFSILILVENAREGSVNTIPVARDVFMWYYKNRVNNNPSPQTSEKSVR